ncbi:SDR family NAD(P)-dependent oxidoreductase [Paraflavisolibacter sp. H34]|uniref:SDR family NAD(P)-dependent oxidoreductase n=1 Tax=Huijunlia imazamoxiresistens TaxID=3127457 RepID=UPI003016082B
MQAPPKYDFEGKVALVTGASSGIGLATATLFAEAGAFVALCAVKEAKLMGQVGKLKAAGHQVIGIPCDVSDGAQVERMFGKILDTFGPVDLAVNNAGIVLAGPTHEVSEEDWHRVLEVNLTGAWRCLQHEIRQMLQKGGGAIVNVSSAGAFIAAPGLAAYTASKHALVGLTKVAALEYAAQNIRINAVCPGWILTPLTQPLFDQPEIRARNLTTIPMGRTGDPAEVAEAVAWLCSDGASLVTAATLIVDGGRTAL